MPSRLLQTVVQSATLGVLALTGLSFTTVLAEDKPAGYSIPSNRVINVADLGAIADGKPHPLKEKYPTQEAIDAKFGPGLYTLEDEQDFVAFAEALRIARTFSRSNGESPLNIGLPEIYLPNGLYKFNRTMEIVNVWGLNIRGAGRASSTIEFTKKGSNLFKIYMSGEISFKDLGFVSTIGSMATMIAMDNNSSEKDGGYRPTFKVRFEEVNWARAYRCIYTAGDEMCSEVILDRCRMVHCLIGIHINNYNSVNWFLNATDFESVPYEPEIYAPFKPADCIVLLVEEGGAVNVMGGSIIHAGRTLLLKSKTEEQKHAGNVFFNFFGVKFEDHGFAPFLFDFQTRAFSPVSVNFYGCSAFHSYSVVHSGQEKPANGRLGNGMNVTLENCLFPHGSFEGVITERTKDNWGSLIANNTRIFRYHEKREGNAEALANVHHHVSNRPGGGYRPEDADLYRKLFALQEMPKDRMPALSPEEFMAFDIAPNETTAVGIKRIVKSISTAAETKGTLRFPKGATLARVQLAGQANNGRINLRLADGQGKNRNVSLVLDPNRPETSSQILEVLNNGQEWDGTIDYDAAFPGLRLVCEYY